MARQGIRYFSALLMLSTILACGNRNESNPADAGAREFSKSTVYVEVEKMLKDYQNAIKENGLLAEFKFLDQSDEFFWVPPRIDRALNYGEVADILTINAGRYQWIDNQWVKLEIFPLAPDIATYYGLVTSAMLDTAGQVSRFRLIESGTVIKRENGWKILCGQTSIVEEELPSGR